MRVKSNSCGPAGPGMEHYMDIKPANINNVSKVYKQNMKAPLKRGPEKPRSSNQDVIEISREGLRQSEFEKTVRAIASEVHKGIPADKINALREAVKSGTYTVPSELIALSILARVSP